MASTAAPAGGRPAAASTPDDDVAELPVANRGLLLVGIMIASLLQVLDITIANVAIPHMQSSLGATPDMISWVLTSYIIASAIAMPITGWLADRVGSRRLFLWSVAGFIGASMLCGLARTLEEMVIFRALQGVAGAFIAPLSQSSMLDVTRRSRHPQVLAIWGMGAMIGPIVGPVLGGWLTENWNWRWVFYVNLPIGLVALAILFAQLPSRQIRKRRFDLFGFAMVALALGALQLLLDRGNQVDWFASAETWIYLGCVISATWVGTIHLATARNPLFHRELFADRNFVISVVGMIAVGAVIFSTMALLPPMLQGLFGYDAIDTGLVLAPRGLGVLISMGLSSWLMRQGIEPRWLVVIGFLMTAWTMEWMAGWSLEVDSFHVWGSGFVQGLAVGLVFIPLNASAFATLPAYLRTEGSSLLNLLRSVGSSIGISVVMTLLARGIQRSHEELASEITANTAGMADLSSLERFQQYGQAGLAMADAEVTRQAAMVAYINDFRLLTWMCLAAVPLVLLMRKNEIHTRR